MTTLQDAKLPSLKDKILAQEAEEKKRLAKSEKKLGSKVKGRK